MPQALGDNNNCSELFQCSLVRVLVTNIGLLPEVFDTGMKLFTGTISNTEAKNNLISSPLVHIER